MSGPRRLIVDGYNVIRSTQPYKDIADVDIDSARAALLADVAGFATGEWHATIVFDGASNPSSEGDTHEVAGIEVVFSKFGTEADTVIERLAGESRRRGEEVHVVTSDAQTQWTVLGDAVRRHSSAEFASELGEERSGWDEHLPSGRKGAPVEDRIDPDVRAVLERWARGES